MKKNIRPQDNLVWKWPNAVSSPNPVQSRTSSDVTQSCSAEFWKHPRTETGQTLWEASSTAEMSPLREKCSLYIQYELLLFKISIPTSYLVITCFVSIQTAEGMEKVEKQPIVYLSFQKHFIMVPYQTLLEALRGYKTQH